MKRTNWSVGDEGIRPAGDPDKCLYCSEPKEGEHKSQCVVRQRTVVVKMTVEYTISVPEFWDKEQLEFHRNQGRWCSDNVYSELERLSEHAGCLCDFTHFEYVREATVEDETRSNVFVTNFPS